MKKRISFTLDKELLDQINESFENSNVAVVLAGGNPKKLKRR